MQRFASILLALCFLSLGTGTLEYLHNLDHEHADAVAEAAGVPVEHHHDESNCDLHAQLHVAMFMTHWVPLLVCLGLFVAFLTLLDTPLIPRPQPARLDCRGPPAR